MTSEELRALADAATPGPWVIDPESPFYDEFSDIETGQWWIRGNAEGSLTGTLQEADARLIAIAPDLARLCAEMGEALIELQRQQPHDKTSPTRANERCPRCEGNDALAKLAELKP